MDMDVSWHDWRPTGKAAGVVPVALLDLAEEYNISPVYAAAVFVLETDVYKRQGVNTTNRLRRDTILREMKMRAF